MFKNPGTVLRKIAKIFSVVGVFIVIGVLVVCGQYTGDGYDIGVAILAGILAAIAVFLVVVILDAFGALVESIVDIRNDRLGEKKNPAKEETEAYGKKAEKSEPEAEKKKAEITEPAKEEKATVKIQKKSQK